MIWALVDVNGVVVNTVVYDESLPHGQYTPPEGLSLLQVNDWLSIGRHIDDPAPQPSPADLSRAIVNQAKYALGLTDGVAIRCLKAGVIFPQEWLTYVDDLRTIVKSGTGILPVQPAYPQGA